MDKKFSIVINHIQDETYAVVLSSWELDIDGNKINVITSSKIMNSLQDALNEIQNFINGK